MCLQDDKMRFEKYSTRTRTLVALMTLSSALGLFGCGGDDDSGFETRIEATLLTSNAPVEIAFRTITQASIDADLNYAWDFGDSEESSGAEPRHTFGAAGTYQVSAIVTASDGTSGRGTVEITLGEPTDLSIQNVQLSSSRAAPGEEVEVTWLIRNAGAQSLRAISAGVFLSTDEVFDPSDTLLTRTALDGLNLDAEGVGQASTITVPQDTPSGTKFLLVVADDESQIGDLDRSNNMGLSAMPFRVQGDSDSGADLVVCGLSIAGIDEFSTETQPVVERTDQLEMEVCISNLGDRPTPVSKYAIFLSTDETLGGDDIKLVDKAGEALGVGERFTVNETIDFSSVAVGDSWYILVVVDPNDETSEQREDNNVTAYRRSFNVVEGGMVEGVDLLVPSITVSQTRVYWGQVLSGALTIQNRGSISVERIFLVRVSLQPTDGGPSVSLTSLNLDGLAAGMSREETFEVTLSQRVAQGEYTLVAEVDPTNSVNDVNEANNTRFFTTALSLGGEPNIDLVPQEVIIDNEEVEAGSMVGVRTRISNDGIDASGPFDVNIILSRDNAGSADDIVLGQFRVENLEGSAETEVEQMVTIPVDIDQAVELWLVGVSVDPENRIRSESREDNNIRFSSTQLRVSGAVGGCSEDEYEPNDNRAAAVPVSSQGLENLGACGNTDWFSVDVPPNSILTVSASEDTATRALRMRLVDFTGQTLSEASMGSRSLQTFTWSEEMPEVVYIEMSSGNPEVGYDLSVNIQDRENDAHLKVRKLSVSPNVAQAGQAVQVSGEIVNVGRGAVMVTETGFFGGAQPGSLGSTFLGGSTTEELAAGTVRSFLQNVSLPSNLQDGSYFISVKPDTGGVTSVSFAADEDWTVLTVDENGACTADDLEPNQSPHLDGGQGSGIVETIIAGAYENLWVCNSDDDWYAVVLEAGQRLSASATYTVADGDVELSLYGIDGLTIIDESASLLGTETVELSRVTQSGTYFLRVFLKNGSPTRENQYDLGISIDDADACPDDEYEPNGDRTGAPLLRDGTHDLFLCESDQDWYRFAIAAGNTVSWQLTSGDAPLRMFLFDESGLVGESDRRIVHQARRNGTHYLQVVADAPGEYAYQIRSSGVSGVDLAMSTVGVSRSAVTANAGFRVTGEVENRRGDFASNVSVQAYLTADAENYEAGVLLGETNLARIDGAEVEPFSMRVQVPSEVELAEIGLSVPSQGFVVAIVDPNRLVPDAQFSNNTASTALSVIEGCVDDDNNTNEGSATATELGDFTLLGEQSGVICSYTEDWYAVDISAVGTMTVSLDGFAGGDLDLSVYANDQVLLASSATENSTESVTVDVDPEINARLFIRVDGFEDSSSNYRLVWGVQ
jgi:hypothetical protein